MEAFHRFELNVSVKTETAISDLLLRYDDICKKIQSSYQHWFRACTETEKCCLISNLTSAQKQLEMLRYVEETENLAQLKCSTMEC